jgi:hypothetical protein
VPSITRYPALIEILQNAPKVNNKDISQVICFRRHRGIRRHEILRRVRSRHRSADAAPLPQKENPFSVKCNSPLQANGANSESRMEPDS